MENENNVNAGADATTEQPKTFDDILSNKEYQAEFDRRINKAIETSRSKWQADMEAEKSEAEKLAKMKAEEKLQYELEKSNKAKDDAISELNAYKLENEAINIATEKKLPVSFLKNIDFRSVKAEEINDKIEVMTKAFQEEVEKAVNERLKEPSRKQINGNSVTTTKELPTIF